MRKLVFTNPELKFESLKDVRLIVTVDKDSVESAKQFINEKRDKPYVATIVLYSEPKTQSANDYAWKLMRELGRKFETPPEPIYREIIRKTGEPFSFQVETVRIGEFIRTWETGDNPQRPRVGWICENLGESNREGFSDILAYPGSSTYTRAQMSYFLTEIIFECKQNGVETEPPQKIASLIDSWRE